MLHYDPIAIESIAAEKGWLHIRGRLAGTINAAAMAEGVGVHRSTILRAYEGGIAGVVLLEKLSEVSGLSLDQLVERRAA